MKNTEHIPINIWDDFYEDDYVPEGAKQETYIYVEDSEIPLEKRKEYLEKFLDYINNNLNTENIKVWLELFESRKKYPNLVGNPDAEKLFFDRWEIKVEGLSHKRLNEWMETLGQTSIEVDGILFDIYSES